MCEVAFGHEVVGFDDAIKVRTVNAYCDTHNHMLWAFGHTAIDAQEARALECFETKAAQFQSVNRMEMMGKDTNCNSNRDSR
jgi:hypothetical protein